MQGAQCQHENPEGTKFCNECAAPLPLASPSCGTVNRPGAKFWHECATPLATPPAVANGQKSVARAKPAISPGRQPKQGKVKAEQPSKAQHPWTRSADTPDTGLPGSSHQMTGCALVRGPAS
jgi:Double zinc ribbon